MPPLHDGIPEAPRIISLPSPVPETPASKDICYPPVTHSTSRHRYMSEVPEYGQDEPASKRARRRSRSPTESSSVRQRNLGPDVVASKLVTNGHLSPLKEHLLSRPKAKVSRSPSPLGLIPLHAHYRNFIHRHEIPRKLLHVSIGFIALSLYSRGVQPIHLAPWLLTAFVPIAAIDVVRHRSEAVNKLYIRVVGALMRETEVSGYNGVMWYVLGAYAVLQFLPKDIGVLSILLVSWCDTAASTFGRLYGRNTIRLRQGKSLAGTLAAFCVGVFTAATFWGYVVPTVGSFPNDIEGSFMFTGRLNLLPGFVKGLLGWQADTPSVSIMGAPALGIMSIVSGVMAAGSEFLDVFGWDDNFTIPVLSGFGIWAFLKIFG